MPIDSIRGYVTCDSCGTPFSAGIDEPTIPPAGWSMFDIAADAVRGSLEYQYETLQEKGKRPWIGNAGLSSVQNGELLCCECTAVEDRKHDDDV